MHCKNSNCFDDTCTGECMYPTVESIEKIDEVVLSDKGKKERETVPIEPE